MASPGRILLVTLVLFSDLSSSQSQLDKDNETEEVHNAHNDPYEFDQTQEAWSAVVLDCPIHADLDAHVDGLATEDDLISYAWITPNHHLVFYDPASNETSNLTPEESEVIFEECVPETAFVVTDDDHLEVLANGSLRIDFIGWGDRGYYQCLALNRADNSSRTSPRFYVSLQHHFRNHVYYFSTMYAVTAAVGFLLLTLLFKLVYFTLETYGCCLCCCCCEDRLPPKAKKVQQALDSIETYKQKQLDTLRDNYTQQSEWIRENCAAQMDRVRDNYNSQVQNIRDIRQFGSTHISAVREQYYEQMNRIRDYSTGQLDKAHENYIFQRQRLRKFSAQNYLRMRATGQYTQRTLGRVMENIPPLYLDLSNCRQGMGGRATSIHLYPEDFQIAELAPLDENEASLERHPHLKRILEVNPDDEEGSMYFTPEDTPLREIDPRLAKWRKPSSLEGTPSTTRPPAPTATPTPASVTGRARASATSCPRPGRSVGAGTRGAGPATTRRSSRSSSRARPAQTDSGSRCKPWSSTSPGATTTSTRPPCPRRSRSKAPRRRRRCCKVRLLRSLRRRKIPLKTGRPRP